MGKVFRFYYCLQCGKRYRKRLNECGCDSKEFKLGPWYIGYYAMGRWREEKVGSKVLAARILKMRESEVAEGKYRLQREKKMLVKDFVEGDYWSLYASKLRSTETVKSRLRIHILPEFGDMYLNQIEPIDIERWIKRLDQQYPISTVNKIVSLLKSIYRKAVEWKLIEWNPTKEIKLRKDDNEVLRYLTQDEYQRLIKAANSDFLRAAITLAVGTMLRKSSLFALKWEYIDIKSRTISIPGELNKNNKALTIPIIEPVLNVLQSLPRGLHSEYVLTNPKSGTRYTRDGLRNSFDKAKRIAGIDPKFRWHDLRHTGASWLVMSGVDLYVVQQLLGHSNITMTQRYAHLAPDYKKNQAEKMSAFFHMESDIGRTKENK